MDEHYNSEVNDTVLTGKISCTTVVLGCRRRGESDWKIYRVVSVFGNRPDSESQIFFLNILLN